MKKNSKQTKNPNLFDLPPPRRARLFFFTNLKKRRKKMKRYLLVGTILIFALCLVAPQGALAARDYFKIGVITSLSGGLATGGNITKQGYDLWAAKVNEAGGIEINGKKYPVKLIYGDAQSEPSQAASQQSAWRPRKKLIAPWDPILQGLPLPRPRFWKNIKFL